MKLDKGPSISPFSCGKKDILVNAKTFVGTEIVDGKSVINFSWPFASKKIIQSYLSVYISIFIVFYVTFLPLICTSVFQG